MKKSTLIFLLLISIAWLGFAQVPAGFNYQAVVRNSSGDLVADQNVSFRISILQGTESGSVIYSEKHTAHTNSFGLANLIIGNGTVLSGVFSSIGWGNSARFIKIEVDVAGGNSFVHVGTSQLLSVPYAFHAKTVENDQVNDNDANPSNELQTISLSGTQLTLSDGGGTVTLPSSGGGDNWGTQTVVSDATLTGNGTNANPLSVVGELTDNQTLSISGSDLSISGGNSVTLPSSSSPWITSGDNIYYDAGRVAVGELKSGWPQKFQVVDDDEVLALFMSNNSSAGLDINRSSSTSSSSAQIMFDTDEIRKFRIGLLSGNTNFRISSSLSSLVGIEVETDGDVVLSDGLSVAGSTKLGPTGLTFTEIRELTGTTSTGHVKAVGYPSGYNYTNTRVLSLDVFYNNTHWCSMGQWVGTATPGYNVSAALTSNYIYIYYPDDSSMHNKAFRMVLMKVQ